jgi:hypothetical protein
MKFIATPYLAFGLIIGVGASERTMAQGSTSPSAVFELQKKCQALSEDFAESQVHGAYWMQTITSNYSIRTQHCNAKIALASTRMDLPITQTNFRTYLYDAHTKELLAIIKREGQPPFGEVFDMRLNFHRA